MFTKLLSSRVVTLILYCSAALFLIYVLGIAYYLRPSTDDYCICYLDSQYGLFGSLKWLYTSWSARPAGSFFLILMERLNNFTGNYLPLYVLLIAFHLSVNYFLVRKLLGISVSFPVVILVSAFLFIFTVLPQADFAYFFWVSTVSNYFLNFTFFQILILSVFFVRSPVVSYPLIIGSTFYSFSSIENFACSNLFILFCLLVYFRKSDYRNRLITALLLGFSFILLMYLSPATAIRQANFPPHSIVDTLIVWQKEFYSFWFWILPKTILYYAVLVPVLFYLGFISDYSSGDKNKTINFILLSGVFTFILIYISIFPNVYAMAELGPPRAYTHLYYYLSVYLGVSSFLIGTLCTKADWMLKFANGIGLTAGCIFLFMSGDYIRINIPEVEKYADSYDYRISLIHQNKTDGKKVLIVPKLYALEAKPYPIYADMLTTDSTASNYWINECMQNSMKLDFKVFEQE
ncbi:MAG: hypothetical protein AB7G44_16405 [Bacteroidia bacterium]